MGSLNGRIHRLEKRVRPATPTPENPEREALIAEIEAFEAEKAAWSKEKREAWDTPQRRAALAELDEEIRRRRERAS